MFEKIENQIAAVEVAEANAGANGYQAPALRSAGSAVKLVRGYSWMSGYDMCGHGIYECE